MTKEIHGIARVKIHAGKMDEYKKLADKCIDIVRTQDPGTLGYALYFSEDGSECIVHEHYRDSEAGLAHARNIGDVLKPMLEICSMSSEVPGSPSPELKKFLDGAGVRIFAPYRGS